MLFVHFNESDERIAYADGEEHKEDDIVYYECPKDFSPRTQDVKLVGGVVTLLTEIEITTKRSEQKEKHRKKGMIEKAKAKKDDLMDRVQVEIPSLSNRKYNFDKNTRNRFFERYQLFCVIKTKDLPWHAFDNTEYEHTKKEAEDLLSIIDRYSQSVYSAYRNDLTAVELGATELTNLNNIPDWFIGE